MGEQIKALASKAWAGFKGMSVQAKTAIVFVVSALLVAKYRDALIDLLLGSSKRVLKDAQAQDATLAAKEDAAKAQATALVDEANKLNQTSPTVDENWNKK